MSIGIIFPSWKTKYFLKENKQTPNKQQKHFKTLKNGISTYKSDRERYINVKNVILTLKNGISTYTNDTVLTDDDQLIGTDFDGNITKNYPLSSLLGYIEGKASFSSTTTIFDQTSASSTWNITHTLSKFPSVTVVDSGNNVVFGEIVYNSNSSITLTFASAFSGKAYLN